MDNTGDQHAIDNFSDGPKMSIACCAKTRLPAPPLAPELFAAGCRLGLKLLALFMSVLRLAIFVLSGFRAPGAITLLISLATDIPHVIALLAKRRRFIAELHAP